MKILKYLLLLVVLSCGYDKPGDRGPAGQDGKDGIDGVDGVDGTNGIDGNDSIVEVIDPCGPSGGFDEVLLRLSDGNILAYFENGTTSHLALIGPGAYITTDSQRCRFTIDEDMNVTD